MFGLAGQISVVICRVIFAMFLGSSSIGYFFFAKRGKFSATFSSTTNTSKRTQPTPQGFSVVVPFLQIPGIVEIILLDITNVLLMWSTLAGYDEPAGGFKPCNQKLRTILNEY